MEDRPFNALPILAAIVMLLLPTVYAGTYFMRGELLENSRAVDADLYRNYEYRWEAMLFKPAARIESTLTGERVSTGTNSTESSIKPSDSSPRLTLMF